MRPPPPASSSLDSDNPQPATEPRDQRADTSRHRLHGIVELLRTPTEGQDLTKSFFLPIGDDQTGSEEA
jgi:hypothetical protein